MRVKNRIIQLRGITPYFRQIHQAQVMDHLQFPWPNPAADLPI